VHVAGTNGKGTVTAFVGSMARAAGKNVGVYTSPHLCRFAERINIGGAPIEDDKLVYYLNQVMDIGPDLTFFEVATLAALWLFARESLEAAVLEVGLGGRLDAINLVDADASVVTTVDLDHQDWLGDDRDSIGREKAGIFRAGRPAVLGSTALPRSVFEEIERVGARALQIGRDFHVRSTGASARWEFDCGHVTLRELPAPALTGAPQLANAATALAALSSGSFGITLDAERTGRALRSVSVPGRFQIVPGEVEWVLDVAHNVPAAAVLVDSLRLLPKRRTIAVCGILADKDVAGIAATLAADVDVWIPATLSGPRALSRDELARRLPAGARVDAHAGDVASACRRARTLANPGDRIVVFGSFLTVGPALEFLGI